MTKSEAEQFGNDFHLDINLFHRFVTEFFGYGDLSAPLWFVGMEEGGETSLGHLLRTLENWKAEGCSPTINIVREGEPSIWFSSERPPIQRTWRQIIRSTLIACGATLAETDAEAVRRYQRDFLGRPNTKICLLELMPLPSRNLAIWPYSDMIQIDYMQSRSAYMDELLPARIATLRHLIEKHKPKAVIFYGASYLSHWKAIAGADVEWTQGQSFGVSCVSGEMPFFSVKHPTAFGVKDAIFTELGNTLRKLVADSK